MNGNAQSSSFLVFLRSDRVTVPDTDGNGRFLDVTSGPRDDDDADEELLATGVEDTAVLLVCSLEDGTANGPGRNTT